MRQEKIFKCFLNIILISAQLFGFWPYVFDANERLFRPSKWIYFYSVFMMTSINYAHFVYFQKLHSFFLTIFKSEGAKVTILYCVAFSSVITILVYVVQFVKMNRMNAIYVRSKCLMQKLNRTIKTEGLSYTNELLLFATKAFVLGSLHIFFSYIKLTSDPKSILFGFIIPDLMNTVMANVFYGAVLIILVYLRQTNKNIFDVTHVAIQLNGNDRTNLEKVETLCRLSDRINELAACQYQLCYLTRDVCCIFSVHLTCWLIHKVCIILIQIFLIYILVVQLILRGDIKQLVGVIISFTQVLLTFTELLLVSKTCDEVNIEVLIFVSKHYIQS